MLRFFPKSWRPALNLQRNFLDRKWPTLPPLELFQKFIDNGTYRHPLGWSKGHLVSLYNIYSLSILSCYWIGNCHQGTPPNRHLSPSPQSRELHWDRKEAIGQEFSHQDMKALKLWRKPESCRRQRWTPCSSAWTCSSWCRRCPSGSCEIWIKIMMQSIMINNRWSWVWLSWYW